jgi:HlyD family secretion protein
MNQDKNKSDPQKPEIQQDQAVPSTEELTTNDTQKQAQTKTEQTKPASANTNPEQKSKAIKLIG